MRREILRAGMAVAFAASAAACKNETSPPTDSSFKVAPGECGRISDDLAICNLPDRSSNRILAILYRTNNGNLQQIKDNTELEIIVVEDTKKLEGPLEGLELISDGNFILTVSVNEPLLSATPAPTPLPSPTPFRIKPIEDPSTF